MAKFKKIKLSPTAGSTSPKRSTNVRGFFPTLLSFGFQRENSSQTSWPKKRISKKKLLSRLIVLISLILLLGGFYLIRNNIFGVKKIDIKNVLSCIDVNSLSQDKNILGKNIFLLNSEVLEKSLKAKSNCLDTIKITKNFPDQIILEMSPKVPVSAFNLIKRDFEVSLALEEATSSTQTAKVDYSVDKLTSRGIYLVDQSGTLYTQIQITEVGDLPFVYFLTDDIESGKNIPQNNLDIFLELTKRFKTLDVVVKSFKIDGSKLIIDGRPKIILSLDKDPLRQAASLQLILQKAKMNSSSVDTVDLRFDKPVVLYGASKNR